MHNNFFSIYFIGLLSSLIHRDVALQVLDTSIKGLAQKQQNQS